jgi:hypothetical protein
MPPAAGVYSRAEYNIAKQLASEDVGGWPARLRDLYNRAYRRRGRPQPPLDREVRHPTHQ